MPKSIKSSANLYFLKKVSQFLGVVDLYEGKRRRKKDDLKYTVEDHGKNQVEAHQGII